MYLANSECSRDLTTAAVIGALPPTLTRSTRTLRMVFRSAEGCRRGAGNDERLSHDRDRKRDRDLHLLPNDNDDIVAYEGLEPWQHRGDCVRPWQDVQESIPPFGIRRRQFHAVEAVQRDTGARQDGALLVRDPAEDGAALDLPEAWRAEND